MMHSGSLSFQEHTEIGSSMGSWFCKIKLSLTLLNEQKPNHVRRLEPISVAHTPSPVSCFRMNVFNNKSRFSPIAPRPRAAAVISAREAAVYLKRAIRVISLCGSFTIFGHWMHGGGRAPGQTNLEQPGQVGRLARRGVSANCLLARNGMAITIGTTGQLAVAPLCSGCPPSSPALSIYLSTMCLRSFLVNILERRGGARRAQFRRSDSVGKHVCFSRLHRFQ